MFTPLLPGRGAAESKYAVPLQGFKLLEKKELKKMVIQILSEKIEVPKGMEKEISTLYELGLEDYEIKYIIAKKTRLRSKEMWEQDF